MSKYLPDIAWRTILREVTLGSIDYQYTAKVFPEDPNEPGADPMTVDTECWVVDYAGYTYQIVNVSGDILTLYDVNERKWGGNFIGPTPNMEAYVYKPKNGAFLLTQAQLRYLDKSAKDLLFPVEKGVSWAYRGVRLTDDSDSYENVTELELEGIEVESKGTGWQGGKKYKLKLPGSEVIFPELLEGRIFVGNEENKATGVELTLNSSDGTFNLSSSGVLTLPDASTLSRGLLKSTDFLNFQESFGWYHHIESIKGYGILTKVEGDGEETKDHWMLDSNIYSLETHTHALNSNSITGILPVSKGGTGLSSGTTNRIPYWSNNNVIGVSKLYWNDTSERLGIGATSFSGGNKVRIHEATATEANIRITNSIATTGLHLGIQSDGEARIYHRNNFGLRFGTNNTSRLLITAAGVAEFSQIPELPNSNPTTDNQATRKKYVDDTFIEKPNGDTYSMLYRKSDNTHDSTSDSVGNSLFWYAQSITGRGQLRIGDSGGIPSQDIGLRLHRAAVGNTYYSIFQDFTSQNSDALRIGVRNVYGEEKTFQMFTTGEHHIDFGVNTTSDNVSYTDEYDNQHDSRLLRLHKDKYVEIGGKTYPKINLDGNVVPIPEITDSNHITTKKYVDNKVRGSWVSKNGAQTLVLSDEGNLLRCYNAGDITIPTNTNVAFPLGTSIYLLNYYNGIKNIVGQTGVTIYGNTRILERYKIVKLVKRTTSTWYVVGNEQPKADFVAKSGAATLILTDAYKYLHCSGAGNITVPLNSSVDFEIGTIINICNEYNGIKNIVGATGVTLRGDTRMMEQYKWVQLVQRVINTWYVIGGY